MKKEYNTLDDLLNIKKKNREIEDKIIKDIVKAYREKKRKEEIKNDIEYCFTRFV